jgi:hypothetical protein
MTVRYDGHNCRKTGTHKYRHDCAYMRTPLWTAYFDKHRVNWRLFLFFSSWFRFDSASIQVPDQRWRPTAEHRGCDTLWLLMEPAEHPPHVSKCSASASLQSPKQPTEQLTPVRKDLPENLPAPRPVKKLHTFYETRRFITAFITAHNLLASTLSQFNPVHPILFI